MGVSLHPSSSGWLIKGSLTHPLTPIRAYLASWPHQFHMHLRGNKNTQELCLQNKGK